MWPQRAPSDWANGQSGSYNALAFILNCKASNWTSKGGNGYQVVHWTATKCWLFSLTNQRLVSNSDDQNHPIYPMVLCPPKPIVGSGTAQNLSIGLFTACGCSSVDRVLASEAKGRGFDPRQPHQNQ